MTQLLAVTGIVIISFSAILIRLADVDPSTAAFYRTAYALPALFLIWLVMRRRDRRSRKARWMAFASGLLLAVDLILWHHAIGAIGAGLATVLANTQVVFVGAAVWFLFRERPSRTAFATAPFIFLGVWLISGLGRPDAYGNDPVAGTIYAVLAGLTYAFFILIYRASNRRLVHASGPLLDATGGAAVGALVIGYFDGGLDLEISAVSHGWLLVLALAVQVGGWILISTALPRLPTLETSVLLLVQPTGTLLWALILFGERLSPAQWTGAALVIGGVGLVSIRGIVETARDARPATGRVGVIETTNFGEEV